MTISRRSLIAATLSMPFLARPGRAAGRLVAAAFPGDTEDMFRKHLVPILSRKSIDLVVAPVLAQDQVGKMMASPGKPPYDALYVSPGQTAALIENKLIARIEPSKIPSWGKLDPSFQTEWGPTVHVQVDGIAYNPAKVPRPKGYRDLFENKAYDNRISLLGFGSNTATVAWVEIAKVFGGGPANMEPMFELLQRYLPRIGAIANSGSQQQSLFQQGEVDVFIASTGNVARLKSLGVPCEFVKPETGCPALPVYIHLAAGAADSDAVYAYMDAAISAEVQNIFKAPPMAYFPTNREVELPQEIAAYITRSDLASLVYPDWVTINANRGAWTERFNKTVAKR